MTDVNKPAANAGATERDQSPHLAGQTAVVTGANSGIGEAIARALAARGAAVVVNYHAHPDDADRVVRDIVAAGGRATAVAADVSKEADVDSLFAATVREFGTVDILVSNAGLQQDAALADMTLAQWQKVIDVNLTGGFLCARAAVREFLRRGPRPAVSRATGKIIFTSSVHEAIPWAGHANYAASKGGIKLLMESIAQELGPRRIRVNSIAPGAIKTNINVEAWSTPEAERKLLKLIPYGRVGDPDDIGRVAAWLASDDADYVHGATLFVDGGMTLYPGFAGGG
ncbi:MAG: glucose 1-dehydrogenase [Gemmatimonadaceae bacterium]|nr:glucose 1-dehydrogenase [Gemmatimonadaceae bacterium]NUR21107.1 glucose 1-dehydrogenase [Gemmatimonadaceae bacterium]